MKDYLQSLKEKNLRDKILMASTVLLALGSMSILAGKLYWLLDLATHFQTQYGIGLFVLGVIFLFLRNFRWALISLFFFLFNFSLIFPLYRAHPLPSTNEENLRILFFNILYTNSQYERIKTILNEEQPDLVVLAETNETTHNFIQQHHPEYAYAYFRDGRGAFGITVLSKEEPVTDPIFHYFGETAYPSIEIVTTLSNKPVHIIGTHPFPPIYPQGALNRNKALLDMAEYVSKIDDPVIVAGDLNTTSWSPYFRSLLNISELRDSRIGFGINPSWPSSFPWFLRIPIDHILVSEEISVVTRSVLDAAASDHRPIMADARINRE